MYAGINRQFLMELQDSSHGSGGDAGNRRWKSGHYCSKAVARMSSSERVSITECPESPRVPVEGIREHVDFEIERVDH